MEKLDGGGQSVRTKCELRRRSSVTGTRIAQWQTDFAVVEVMRRARQQQRTCAANVCISRTTSFVPLRNMDTRQGGGALCGGRQVLGEMTFVYRVASCSRTRVGCVFSCFCTSVRKAQ